MIDEIDREILKLLQNDGRATQRAIGNAVGLSANAAGARVAKLIADEVITGFHAHLDGEKIGRPLEASVDIWLSDRLNDKEFVRIVKEDDRIVEAFHLTGPVDYRIQVRISSPHDLEEMLELLRKTAGVSQTDSRLILSRYDTLPPIGD